MRPCCPFNLLLRGVYHTPLSLLCQEFISFLFSPFLSSRVFATCYETVTGAKLRLPLCKPPPNIGVEDLGRSRRAAKDIEPCESSDFHVSSHLLLSLFRFFLCQSRVKSSWFCCALRLSSKSLIVGSLCMSIRAQRIRSFQRYLQIFFKFFFYFLILSRFISSILGRLYHFSFVSFYFDPMKNNKFTTVVSESILVSSLYYPSLISFFLFFPSFFFLLFFKWRIFLKEREREALAGLAGLVGSFAPCWGPPLVMGPGIIITIEKKRNPVGGHTPRHGQFPQRSKQKKILT